MTDARVEVLLEAHEPTDRSAQDLHKKIFDGDKTAAAFYFS